jgi:methyl-accepting chemotaxis protein
VNQTIDSLATIHETVAEAVAKVRHLGQYSQQALQLVTFIDELAVKMNEQSMAVTIESGRTNGGGQGSMVVVTEAVRSLTQQLTGVTAKIAPIMAAIDAEANDVAAEMEIGVQQALSGTERVKTIREQLNQVETIGTKMNAIVGKIAQSANNQGQFSLSTRQAILEISSLANRVSESSAAVAESLSQSFGIVDDF